MRTELNLARAELGPALSETDFVLLAFGYIGLSSHYLTVAIGQTATPVDQRCHQPPSQSEMAGLWQQWQRVEAAREGSGPTSVSR